MKIKINKFCLRHNETLYKKGDVVDIEDEDVAKRLVANSDGNFTIFHPEDEIDGKPKAEKVIEQQGNPSAEKDSNEENNSEVILPDADPAAAVSQGKQK